MDTWTQATGQLSARERARAAEIAPVLRMLRHNRTERASVISFRLDENQKHGAGLPGGTLSLTGNLSAAEIMGRYESFTRQNGAEPKIVRTEDGLGFALGERMEEAAATLKEFFAGADRTKPARGSAPDSLARGKRLSQKIVLVTGGAQGFGYGLVKCAAENGAYVAVADINYEGAVKVASEMCVAHGPYSAIAVAMDVTREESVREGVCRTVAAFGGLDVMLSNAGVLRAGALETLSLEDFLYVTNINYVGYFLCAKSAVPVMKLQNEVNPGYWADIIQVNSKSGLTGSNKNCSYSGSKFGGLGLTQSFAMELVEFGIKVNSICPGNYLNGPLWSDPKDGLFMQYLRTNKIPGAKTVEDLKRHYNGKVPMRRSCEAEDIAKAMLYIIEQDYETGQAVPVTGGQIMLK